MNLVGSIRYDQYGRKRKTKAFTKTHPIRNFSGIIEQTTPVVRETKHYPSAPLRPVKESRGDLIDDSYKVEESKKFTVAPSYNKGAYQVIPQGDIKWIGR